MWPCVAFASIGALICLSNERLFIDQLTGLFNRTFFESVGAKPKNRRQKFAGVMLDINGFKKINDTYGHLEGNEALVSVANILLEAVDSRWMIIRYGGDEFAIISEDEGKDLEQMTQRIEEGVERFNASRKKPYVISISIGSCEYDPQVMDVSTFFERLDESMYASKQAYYRERNADILTGLMSTKSFEEAVYERVVEDNRESYSVAFFNIRHFKELNLHRGAEAGDEVLLSLATLLKHSFQDGILARYSADHFIALIPFRNSEERLLSLCEEFNHQHDMDQIELKVGIYHIDSAQVPIMNAYNYAKIACDSIKNDHNLSLRFLDDNVRQRAEISQYVAYGITEALERGEIEAFYQPCVRVLSKSLCSFEVLSRWNSPQYGMMTPDLYINDLEKNGQIKQHDLYIVEKACQRLVQERDRGRTMIPLSVNLSRADLVDGDIVSDIVRICESYQIPHHLLTLEITETVVTENSECVKDSIRRLREAGFCMALDDFGKGISSLHQMSVHGFDVIKLDMSLLQETSEQSTMVVKGTVKTVRQLPACCVAEGVENYEQYDFLKGAGCEKVQGYLFGAPSSYEAALARCAAMGVEVETPELNEYYSAIGKIDLTGNKALAIVEYKDEVFTFLHVSEGYQKVWRAAGRTDIGEIYHNMNASTSPLAKRFREFGEHLSQDHGVREMTYVVDGSYMRVMGQQIASCEGRVAYQAEVFNVMEQVDEVAGGKMDNIYRMMYYLYDGVYIINSDGPSFIPMSNELDVSNKGLVQQMSAEAAFNFLRTVIHPDDYDEYRAWLEPSTYEERLAQTKEKVLMGYFRGYDKSGQMIWKQHKIVAMPDGGKHSFLYVVENIPSFIDFGEGGGIAPLES